MRTICFLFLLLFAGAVGAFALFNQEEITLRFFDWQTTMNIAAIVGIAFVLGMFGGWSIVGMLRRSIHRVTAAPPPGYFAGAR